MANHDFVSAGKKSAYDFYAEKQHAMG